MNKTYKIIIAVVVICALLIGAYAYFSSGRHLFGGTTNFSDLSVDSLTTTVANGGTGIITSGGNVVVTGYASTTGTVYGGQGLFEGGVNSTTTPASMTMAVTDFNTVSLVSINPTVAAVTMTFPATSTMKTFLPNAGDSTWEVFHNSTTTASINVTLSGGTGTLMTVATSSAATTAVIQPGKTALCRMVRKVNTDIIIFCSVGL